MKTFRVNDYITVKLEYDKSNIYFNNTLFMQSKFLLLGDLHVGVIEYFRSHFRSVDEEELLYHNYEYKQFNNTKIPHETEFWAHCSNLQVWAENNYKSCLLHSNLAFPLLKKLVEAGDPQAKKVFKEEIVKRLESGYPPVIEYLVREDYTRFLNSEELLFSVLVPEEAEILLEIESNLFECGKENFDLVIVLELEMAPCFTVKNKHVIEIGLFDCGLDFLPESIGELSFLESLDLRDNKISEIPKSIAKLKKLKFLKKKIEN